MGHEALRQRAEAFCAESDSSGWRDGATDIIRDLLAALTEAEQTIVMAERRIADLCDAHEEQHIARESAESRLAEMTRERDRLQRKIDKRPLDYGPERGEGLGSDVLGLEVKRLTEALAQAEARERQAFEAGWNAYARQQEFDAAYARYQAQTPDQKPVATPPEHVCGL